MQQDDKYSPAPWKWTDFGVLSVANGEAILDHENWNVFSEDSVLISAAPELLEWIARTTAKYGGKFEADDLAAAKRLIAGAANPHQTE